MTNFEKYKDDILEIADDGCNIAYSISKKNVTYCGKETCDDCLFTANTLTNCGANCLKWLYEEAPALDWTTVKKDTKVYVRDDDLEDWALRYFAKYDPILKLIYVYPRGSTSWSATLGDNRQLVGYSQGKLAE